MKKIVNVNVGGFAFVIEEQAYEMLSNYLGSVKRNLGTDVDADEVMADIELRIAELFREQLKGKGKEVVEESLIQNVISIMGKPEDYGNGEPVNEKQQEAPDWTYADTGTQRKLFRDPDQKMLGGVASGLGNYFGWDPLAVRIIFLLLVFGFGIGIPLYIILWILVPEAKTTNDRLRMHGRPITVDTIKQGFSDFKNDVRNFATKDGQRKFRHAAASIGDRIEGAFSDFGKAAGKFIGVIFLVIGLVIFAILMKFAFTGSVSMPESAAEELFFSNVNLFFDNINDYYIMASGILVLSIVVLWGLISTAIELLFGAKIRSKPVKYAMIAFSVIAVTAIVYGGINFGKNYNNEEYITKKYDIPMKDSIVHISVLKDEYFNNRASTENTNEDELVKVTQNKIVFGHPVLNIQLSENGRAYYEVEKFAWGPRSLKAIENCEAIEYPVLADTGSLVLPAVFSTSIKNKFRGQHVTGTLYVPVGTIVENKHNMKRIFSLYNSYSRNSEMRHDAERYIMRKEGLEEYKN